jgi:hypothetical protein
MATNRKRTPRSRTVQTLHPGAINWLYDRQDPTEKPWKDRFFMDREDYKKLWMGNRDDVLEWWATGRPCTRPSGWWRFEAMEQLSDGESQAAYLQRHGLLTTEEKAHLKKHPVLLEPMTVTVDEAE